MENLDPAPIPDSNDDDANDEHLFKNCSSLAKYVIPIKHNDPKVTSFELYSGEGMDGTRWRRLGRILGRNTCIEKLGLGAWDLDVAGLCAGLQNNRRVKKLWLSGIDFRNGRLGSLAPFLSNNPSLQTISLLSCNLESGSIDILSNALLSRADHTLEEFSLSGSNLGDVNLDKLVLALKKSQTLRKIFLTHNGIGRNGCSSLATLLKDQQLALASLHLDENSIDDDSAVILANSLAENTALKSLSLHGNNGITAVGWSAMLKLVCDGASVESVTKSNHRIVDLGMQLFARDRESVDNALGADDGHLLRASLERNRRGDKASAARGKVLWCHARGNFNVGDCSIAAGAIPRVLAFIGDVVDEPNANLVQYHEPPLSGATIDSIRLDSIYRIVVSRPDLFMRIGCKKFRDERVGANQMQDDTAYIHNDIENFICLVLFGLVTAVLFRMILVNGTEML